MRRCLKGVKEFVNKEKLIPNHGVITEFVTKPIGVNVKWT